MKVSVLLFLLTVLVGVCWTVGNARATAGKCGAWRPGPCQNLNKNGGTCGRGVKKATRTGDRLECGALEKDVPCRVPCPGDKKVCKYRKGQWGVCDGKQTKRIKIDTLMIEASDPTCEKTKSFEKVCKKKKCEYGAWGEFGACGENGLQYRTRPITSGTVQDCEAKSKKSRRCGGGGGGGGGGAGGGNRQTNRRRGNGNQNA